MDPMYQALSSQGLLLGQHDRFLRALVDSNQSVSAHISELSHQGSTPASSVQDSRLPSLIEVAPASLASRDIHQRHTQSSGEQVEHNQDEEDNLTGNQ